jgi:hypothetical protein
VDGLKFLQFFKPQTRKDVDRKSYHAIPIYAVYLFQNE